MCELQKQVPSKRKLAVRISVVHSPLVKYGMKRLIAKRPTRSGRAVQVALETCQGSRTRLGGEVVDVGREKATGDDSNPEAVKREHGEK